MSNSNDQVEHQMFGQTRLTLSFTTWTFAALDPKVLQGCWEQFLFMCWGGQDEQQIRAIPCFEFVFQNSWPENCSFGPLL